MEPGGGDERVAKIGGKKENGGKKWREAGKGTSNNKTAKAVAARGGDCDGYQLR